MKSAVVKRSVIIAGHETSVSLEDAFWSELKQIASGCDRTLSEMVATIDTGRAHSNLSSAIRLFVLITINVIGRRTGDDQSTIGSWPRLVTLCKSSCFLLRP